MVRTTMMLLALAVTHQAVQAQLLESLIPVYFTKRPEDCTGPDSCSTSTLYELTKHIIDNIWWGGFVLGADAENEYYSCLDATDKICLLWEANEFSVNTLGSNSNERETGLCECELVGSQCSTHSDSSGDPAPGNLTSYANEVCDPANYNADCGWDGGDCANVVFAVGTTNVTGDPTLDYTLPVVGSDNYCAVWSCTQTEYGTSTYCSSYSWYYTGWWRDRRLLEEDDMSEFQGHGTLRRSLRRYSCRTRSSSQAEYTECACTEESENGNYCAKWYCEESSNFGSDAEDRYRYWYYSYYGYHGGDEKEWYECKREGDNGLYCEKWGGVVQSDPSYEHGEIELASCDCTSTSVYGVGSLTDSNKYPTGDDALISTGYIVDPNYAGHCTNWQCYEEGWAYWTPNWVAFGVILGFLLIGVCAGIFWGKKKAGAGGTLKKGCCGIAVIIFFILVILSVDFLGWWSAGIIGGIVYTVVFVIAFGTCIVFACRRRGGCDCDCDRPKPNPPRAERPTRMEMVTLEEAEQPEPAPAPAPETAIPAYPVARLASEPVVGAKDAADVPVVVPTVD